MKGARALGLFLALTLALAGCAGPRSEQHLAPLYTHVSTVGGGEEYEALAGALIARRDEVGAPFSQWGLRPLFLHYPDRDGRSKSQFLYPLGKVDRGGGEFNWWLLPIADYRRETRPEGRKWQLLALPGLYFARFPDGRRASAFFPFGGTMVEQFTFDEIEFVLWPLYMRTVQQGRTSYHFPFPFLMYRYGPDGGGWRVWPILGHSWVDDRYDRWFAVWPIFNLNEENLKSSPRYHESHWSMFPVYGYRGQGSWSSHGVLWPFFGYASDPQTGFWAFDGPWPLVRLQFPGEERLVVLPNKQGAYTRIRFWPFWSYYEGDGLVSRWYAWPLVNVRSEDYEDGHRDAFTFIPFWSQWKRRYDDGPTRSFRKLWPVFQYERTGETRSYLFPQLSPFWYWPDLDEHYAWIYALYAADHGPEITKENALWGLWRREHDVDEERTYVSGLWSRRAYSEGGDDVSEHSLLFGLLRWRSHARDGLSLLRPSLPGPGWPVARVPRSAPAGAPEDAR